LIQRHGADPAKLLPSLASYDEAVAAQAAALCHSAGLDLRSPEFKRSLAVAPQTVQRGFAAFSETVLPIEP
jgi:hypothetical protein